MIKYIIILLLFATTPSLAGNFAYTCEIVHIYDISDTGEIKLSGFDESLKGGTFEVSRVNGEIIGSSITTNLANSTRVVSFGSTGFSFRALAEFDNSVQILEVKEFIKGEIKPFVALSMGGAGIVTGTCK